MRDIYEARDLEAKIYFMQGFTNVIGSLVYIPNKGRCLQLKNYTTSQDLTIVVSGNTEVVNVYVTDPGRDLYFAIEDASSAGDRISIPSQNTMGFYYRLVLQLFEILFRISIR